MSREAHAARPVRCLAVWCPSTAGVAALLALLVPRLSGLRSPSTAGSLPFEALLVQGCAAAVAVCGVWAWAATTAAVLEASTGLSTWGRPCPARLRVVVLAACGAALVLGPSPAMADQIVGLPPTADETVPAAALVAPAPRSADPTAARTAPRGAAVPAALAASAVAVTPGDSLWAIAARTLPAGATDAHIDSRWREIWRANRGVVGPNPDHIEPRMVLRVDKES